MRATNISFYRFLLTHNHYTIGMRMQLDIYSVYEAMKRENLRPFSESVAQAGAGKAEWELGVRKFADHMQSQVIFVTIYWY